MKYACVNLGSSFIVNFVDFESLESHAKFQDHQTSGSEDDFYVGYLGQVTWTIYFTFCPPPLNFPKRTHINLTSYLMFVGVGVSCRILYFFVGYLYVSSGASITSFGEGELICLLLFTCYYVVTVGKVSSSSGCFRWATLFYCGTP